MERRRWPDADSLCQRERYFTKNELQRNIGCYFLSQGYYWGTKVSWVQVEKFFFKIYAALNGGVDKVIGICMNKV
jgi:hypothetical protein